MFLLYQITVSGQNFEVSWQSCFGGSLLDGANDMVTFDNGFIIAGATGSNDGDISASYGNGDGWVVCIDSTGNMLWEKNYGGSDSEAFDRIISTLESNYYLLGISWSSDGDISSDPYPNSPDYWIVKIDSDGNIIWDKIIGGNSGERLWSGASTLDGGVVVIGETSSNDGDVSVFYGGNETWIAKLSSEGELEWDFTIGTDFADLGQAIIQTSDGGYLAASSSWLGDGGNITCESHGYAEAVLFKLDADLNVEWQHCYGGSDHDGIVDIIEVEDGYVFGAYTSSNDGDVSGYNGGISDTWIVKLDFEGNIIWQNALGGSNADGGGKNIYETDDQGFVAVLNTDSNDGDVSGNHGMSDVESDIWFIRLNSDGELIYQQCFGGARYEEIHSGVIMKSDNNFVIAGNTNYGPSYDVGCLPYGGIWDEDFWVFEIDMEDTTGIFENNSVQDGLKVYPNPAKEYVIFEIQDSRIRNQDARLLVIDVFGQEVASFPFLEDKMVWDCREVKNGLYFYNIEIEGKRYGGKVVIQK